MTSKVRLGKLRWLCRRGMKELDVLLERFTDSQAIRLQDGAWPELESLLESEDDCFWDWIQDPTSAPARFRPLIEELRRVR